MNLSICELKTVLYYLSSTETRFPFEVNTIIGKFLIHIRLQFFRIKSEWLLGYTNDSLSICSISKLLHLLLEPTYCGAINILIICYCKYWLIPTRIRLSMIFKILHSFLSHIGQHNTVFYKTCIVSLCILVHHFTIIPYRFDVATRIHLFFPSLFKPAEYTFGKKSVCESIRHENQETYTGNSLGKSRRNETSHDRESDENSPTVTNQ